MNTSGKPTPFVGTAKQRFSTTDTTAMVRDLRPLLGQRVANVYDVNDKTYLFKFAIPGQSEKVILLLESGIRFHTTKYARDKSNIPSPFAMKLRKFIRLKRLESVQQMGTDRVVDFKFGSGDAVSHIILELYANGNIVLTDANYEILALLRSHQFEEDVACKVGEIYPIAFATSLAETAASGTSSGTAANAPILSMTPEDFKTWAKEKNDENLQRQKQESDNKGKGGGGGGGEGKKSKVKPMNLRQLLLLKDSGVANNGPDVLDHCLLTVGLSPSMKIDQFLQTDSLVVSNLQTELAQGAPKLTGFLGTPGQPGYVLTRESSLPSGFSTTSSSSSSSSQQQQQQQQVMTEYVDFVPHLFKQHQGRPYLEFPSFDEAVDEYFCKIEEQKLQLLALNAEETARKKVEKVKHEQESLIQALDQQQRNMEKGAILIETYAEEVDKVCLVLNSALESGMSWEDVEAMVETETALGNPIASLIVRLRLDKNRVVLRLKNLFDADEDNDDDNDDNDKDKDNGSDSDNDNDMGDVGDEDDKGVNNTGSGNAKKTTKSTGSKEDTNVTNDNAHGNSNTDAKNPQSQQSQQPHNKQMGKKTKFSKSHDRKKGVLVSSSSSSGGGGGNGKNDGFVEVEFNLALSAHANARNLYNIKKVSQVKLKKTEAAAVKAVQLVEEQSANFLKTQKIKRNLQAVRKVHWFEKFNWFISSEGYLILSGRDAQQNEALVKRYMRTGDIYVHADIPGAASCIVRSKVPGTSDKPASPISPLALQEAGIMTVCRSGAWGAKVVTSAWWVWASQVSKTAPTGEYLTTGSFMIYGKKNFLPPMSLEMGFGIMFRLDDSSVARHLHDRNDKVGGLLDDAASFMTDSMDRYGINFEALEIADGDDDHNDDKVAGNGVGGGSVGGSVGEAKTQSKSKGRNTTALAGATSSLPSIPTLHSDDKIIPPSPPQAPSSQTVAVQDSSESSQVGGGLAAAATATGRKLTAHERKQLKKLKEKGEVVDATTIKVIKNAGKEQHEEKVVGGDNDMNMEEEEEGEGEEGGGGEGGGSSDAFNKSHSKPTNTSKGSTPKSSTGGKPSSSLSSSSSSSSSSTTTTTSSSSSSTNKKKLDKKKARRYAEQDDEDREQAMILLGHAKAGNRPSDHIAKDKAEKEAQDRTHKQQRAGIHFVQENWDDLLSKLAPRVKEAMEVLVTAGIIKEGELDSFEVKTLSSFPADDALTILGLFREGVSKKIGNKSGFLAGIMRRFSKGGSGSKSSAHSANEGGGGSGSVGGEGGGAGSLKKKKLQRGQKKVKKDKKEGGDEEGDREEGTEGGMEGGIEEGMEEEGDQDDHEESDEEDESTLKKEHNETPSAGDENEGGKEGQEGQEGQELDSQESSKHTTLSRRERKKQEQLEIQAILEDEGVLDEQEGQQADEVEKLTGTPLPEDILLYAVPVCGPYSCMTKFKFKVKLTPGTVKKGKACKTAVDVFTRLRECSVLERDLMKGLTDPDLVAIMIGDVKLSMPGLQQAKSNIKKDKRAGAGGGGGGGSGGGSGGGKGGKGKGRD